MHIQQILPILSTGTTPGDRRRAIPLRDFSRVLRLLLIVQLPQFGDTGRLEPPRIERHPSILVGVVHSTAIDATAAATMGRGRRGNVLVVPGMLDQTGTGPAPVSTFRRDVVDAWVWCFFVFLVGGNLIAGRCSMPGELDVFYGRFVGCGSGRWLKDVYYARGVVRCSERGVS